MGDRSAEELEAALGVRDPVHAEEADERVKGPADESPVARVRTRTSAETLKRSDN